MFLSLEVSSRNSSFCWNFSKQHFCRQLPSILFFGLSFMTVECFRRVTFVWCLDMCSWWVWHDLLLSSKLAKLLLDLCCSDYCHGGWSSLGGLSFCLLVADRAWYLGLRRQVKDHLQELIDGKSRLNSCGNWNCRIVGQESLWAVELILLLSGLWDQFRRSRWHGL
jgi:hypothetical protein